MKDKFKNDIQKTQAEMLKADFEREIVNLHCRMAQYKGWNTAMRDKYTAEIRNIERLILVLDVLATQKQ